MHFDALTLACITDELKQTLLGGRVQQVLLPDAHSIGLEIYAQHQRYYLLIAAEGATSRVQFTNQKLTMSLQLQKASILAPNRLI